MRRIAVLCALALIGSACDPASKVGTFDFNHEGNLVVVNPKGVALPALKILDKGGDPLPVPETLTYKVDPAGIAKIVSGKLVPIKKGEAVLMARFSGAETGPSAALSVASRPLDGIEVKCDAPCTVKPGEEIELTARPTSGGDEVVGVKVSWESSSKELLTIDAATGKAKGVKAGRAVVRANAFGVTGAGEVVVKAPAELLEVYCPWPPFRTAVGSERTSPQDLPCEVRVGSPVKLLVAAHAGGELLPSSALRFTTAQQQMLGVAGGELAAKSPGIGVIEVAVDQLALTLPIEAKKEGPPPTWRGRRCKEPRETVVEVGAYQFSCDSKKKGEACLAQAKGFLKTKQDHLSGGFLKALAEPCCCNPGADG